MTDTAWQPTACILCECNCGIEVQLGGEDERSLKLFRGDKAHPVSRGYACEKPHRLDYYQNPRDRLTTPLKRREDGSFEAIGWDQAITEVAERLARIRDEHGGDTIFYYGGGGQGNHLPGAYATATRRVLGSRWRSSALAQEKTGEFWVSDRMLGTFTRGDFEHCEVGVFLGKNPWHSHSIQRARVVLKELSKDPARTLIVIDPRVTETAELADIHLQVKPGTDAWLLAALVAVLLQDDRLDHEFLDTHAVGLDAVREHFRAIDVADYCQRAGVPEALLREAATRIGEAESVASFEDLGVQMNRHSTLVSYLHRLVWLLTGNLGKPGTQYVPSPLVNIAGGASKRVSPVAGARIVGGMVPCNVIAEEILSDHERRYRAMIVEAANPAHSLADGPRMREALGALDTLVVIDVAMSETAQLADYVLPASNQFEKAEATFFNFEFPENYFHLRRRLFAPAGDTLSEAEIHARLVEALGGVSEADLAPLHEAAAKGRQAYGEAFMALVMSNPKLAGVAPVILYRTLGPILPEELREGAVLFGLAFRFAMQFGPSLARAGFSGHPGKVADELFQALLDNPSGVIFAVDAWEEVLGRLGTPDKKVHLALDDLLDEVERLREPEPEGSRDFPFVLAAGERRSFTANTIMRNPEWRPKDAEGALRMSPADADGLGVHDGDRVRIVTRRGAAEVGVSVSDSMQPGHLSLPNGLGVSYPGADGEAALAGVAPNELTRLEDRDPFVGTPWHKYVPARVERLSPAE
jgi:anaerobic selenocysteine-containing dehydrogenase